ncbi:hypothetical protein, partial [Desulfovibrio piger]|uniref:hypothetical protein n=1 Tax=Desulfovibrio piger TaxID=901 RepID=UPI0026F0A0B6
SLTGAYEEPPALPVGHFFFQDCLDPSGDRERSHSWLFWKNFQENRGGYFTLYSFLRMLKIYMV